MAKTERPVSPGWFIQLVSRGNSSLTDEDYDPSTRGLAGDLYCLIMDKINMDNMRIEIERLYGLGMDAKDERGALETFLAFREALSRGELRAAEKRDGRWQANVWVKQGILLGFRLGVSEETHAGDSFTFVDKHTYPVRHFKSEDGVRMVPGGSTVRAGAYVAGSAGSSRLTASLQARSNWPRRGVSSGSSIIAP